MNDREYDDEDDGDESKRGFDPERAEAARELFGKFKKHWDEEQNVTRGKQLEITILELHIHELVEDQIKDGTFAAAAVSLEVQDYLQELQRGARR